MKQFDFLNTPRIDQVGIEDRIARITARSIKKESKMQGLYMALNMIDLTTLEGADTEEKVKQNWEQLKLKEGNRSVLSGVPQSLPALVKAMRIQEKARGAGFDWDEKSQVWEKVEEEMQEFKAHFNAETNAVLDEKEAEAEFGDLLFSLVNYARFVDINPETALERTNKKFIKRFQFLEEHAKADGKTLADMTLSEMDEYWNRAKTEAKN